MRDDGLHVLGALGTLGLEQRGEGLLVEHRFCLLPTGQSRAVRHRGPLWRQQKIQEDGWVPDRHGPIRRVVWMTKRRLCKTCPRPSRMSAENTSSRAGSG